MSEGRRSASDRYAWLLLLLLVPGLALCLSRLDGRAQRESCADPNALVDLQDFPLAERIEIYKSDFEVVRHRVDAAVVASNGSHLPFTIRRSFALPNWLARPTFALPGPREPNYSVVRELEVDGEVVHAEFIYTLQRGRHRMLAYTTGYNGDSTLHPLWRRAFDGASALVRGVRPVTYMGISVQAHPREIEEYEDLADEFLRQAWRHYKKSCHP